MKCSKARKIINDYVDDNLEAKKKSTLEKHLEGCSDCQEVLKDLREIASSAKELDDLSPSAQTWLNIEARLAKEAQTVQVPERPARKWFDFLVFQPRLRYALISAVLLAVVVVGFFLGIRYFRGGITPGLNNHQKYTLAKLEEAERHYQLAIKALAEAVSSRQESLNPQVAEIFKTNLEIIDASIQACREAVVGQPKNIEARNYLLFVYREKLNLLDEMIATRSASLPKKDLKETI